MCYLRMLQRLFYQLFYVNKNALNAAQISIGDLTGTCTATTSASATLITAPVLPALATFTADATAISPIMAANCNLRST